MRKILVLLMVFGMLAILLPACGGSGGGGSGTGSSDWDTMEWDNDNWA